MNSSQILRLPQVIQRTGLSRSTIYLLMKNGKFIKPISLAPRAIGWLERDVEKWIVGRVEASRHQNNQ